MDSWLTRAVLGRISRFRILLDMVIVTVVALIYGRPILNFDESHIPARKEDWDAAIAPMEIARQSILEHGEFPLWNPYMNTGVPYMADPTIHLLNPLASVPALILGTPDGAKVAAALSIIGAGLAMYYLAAVVGVSRPLRVWSGLLMAMSGGLAARVWAGHFNFVVGLPLVPLVFALGLQALRRPGVIYPMLAGLACAVLLFSGQVHYAVFAFGGLLLTFFFVFLEHGWQNGRWSLQRAAPVLFRGLSLTGWTLGFSAIQLVPYLESRDAISAPRYDNLSGSLTVLRSAENFFVPEFILVGGLPGWTHGFWEYYAYVGFIPLLGLAFVVAALRRPDHRFSIIWAASLVGLYLAWAAADHTFFTYIYEAIPWLFHLRAPARALAFASVFLIIVAALGLDYAAAWLGRQPGRRLTFSIWRGTRRLGVSLGPVLALALLIVAFYGLRDVYQTNRALLNGGPRFDDRSVIAEWLHDRDPSAFYLSDREPQRGVPYDYYEQGIKLVDALGPYRFVPPEPVLEPGSPPVSITVAPKYVIARPGDAPASAELIGIVEGSAVYRLEQGPYYASTFGLADPPANIAYPWRTKTIEATARVVSPNVIEVQAGSFAGQDRLLVLESFHSGWCLEVDGHGAGRPDNYGGFLSTVALEGEHTYTFVFDPTSFRYGAAITIGTVLGAALLLLSLLVRCLRRSDPLTENEAGANVGV